ncbi:hypothetical protein SAMN05421595_2445 [Austwickia chelonae]|nr:hypothetical protein SAMN05421595_2445 [Austwickia chelonae]
MLTKLNREPRQATLPTHKPHNRGQEHRFVVGPQDEILRSGFSPKVLQSAEGCGVGAKPPPHSLSPPGTDRRETSRTSARAGTKHLSQSALLLIRDVQLIFSLHMDPASRIQAVSSRVARLPFIGSLVALSPICAVLYRNEHERVIGKLSALLGIPVGCSSAPCMRKGNHVVDVDIARRVEDSSRIRVNPFTSRPGTVPLKFNILPITVKCRIPRIALLAGNVGPPVIGRILPVREGFTRIPTLFSHFRHSKTSQCGFSPFRSPIHADLQLSSSHVRLGFLNPRRLSGSDRKANRYYRCQHQR